ncbi:MAG TPA: PhoH family protein [Pirellulaceae bacterium]|nr:PhoH family protein [Pirellulaceae bacterium]
MTEATLSGIDSDLVVPLFGVRDQYVRRLREEFRVAIVHRDGTVRVSGAADDVARSTEVLEQLRRLVQSKGSVQPEDFARILARATSGGEPPLVSDGSWNLGTDVHPRSPGQRRYFETMSRYDVVFATGPAGTGKTYLAVAMAVAALRQRRIRKIVLVRPAVEAGESLGFLPGDMLAKINPYLRPLLDALQEQLGYEQARKLLDQDVIEVVPLAYMRGRTLSEAFIILDEAQNATQSQMKMFLTRMGNGSKIVVSGDVTQVDLPRTVACGLTDAAQRLAGVEGIGFVHLGTEDIVRHPLVQRIVDAYEDR